jgi:hypothetical protein
MITFLPAACWAVTLSPFSRGRSIALDKLQEAETLLVRNSTSRAVESMLTMSGKLRLTGRDHPLAMGSFGGRC